jgi:hypothetical protein
MSEQTAVERKAPKFLGMRLWDTVEDMRRSNVRRAKAILDLAKNLLVGAGFATAITLFVATSRDVMTTPEIVAISSFGIGPGVIFCAWAVNAFFLEAEIFRPLMRFVSTLLALLVLGATLVVDLNVALVHQKAQAWTQQNQVRTLQMCASRFSADGQTKTLTGTPDRPASKFPGQPSVNTTRPANNR